VAKGGDVVSQRGRRLQSSVLTFGPLGRVVCTAVLFGVLAWFVLYAGLFGIAGAVIWLGWIVPRALRDIWRPAALPPTDLSRLRETAARELAERQRPREAHSAFDEERRHPTRW
jgi:hypothetical protein